MQSLECKVPPPVVCVLFGLAMWGGSRISPRLEMDACIRLAIAAALMAIGLVIALLGGAAFRRAKTTINPLKPETASSLVVSGIYRYTRNPMYLGLAIVLLGWTVYLSAPLTLFGPALFVCFITRFQILPEERILNEKFGAAFADYQRRVRRWL